MDDFAKVKEGSNMTAEILIKFARKGIILSPEAYDLIKSSKNPINLSSEIIVKLKSGNYSKDMVPVDVDTIMKMEGLNLEIKGPVNDEKPKAIEKPAPIQTKPLETKAPTNKPTGVETKKPEEKETGTKLEKPQTTPEKGIELEKPKEEVKPKVNPGYASEHVVKIEDAEVSKEVEVKYKRNLTESKVNFDKFKVLKDTSNKSYTSGEIGNLIEYFQNRYKKLSGILEKRPELRTWQKINEITENQTDLNRFHAYFSKQGQ